MGIIAGAHTGSENQSRQLAYPEQHSLRCRFRRRKTYLGRILEPYRSCAHHKKSQYIGKVVAGGYPGAGGLGGKRELMEHLAAGLQAGKKRAMVGGTLAATPLSAEAGYFTLLEIERTNACEIAGKAGDRLVTGLNLLCARFSRKPAGLLSRLNSWEGLRVSINLKQT
jgi:hypothetical protein